MSDPGRRLSLHWLKEALHTLAFLGLLAASLEAANLGDVALAAPEPVPYKLPSNLLAYFKSRYEMPEDMIVSTLKETPDGPQGSINVLGRLNAAPPAGATREERVRSATRAFLEREAAVLDIADLSEIRELSLKFEDDVPQEWLRGSSIIHYQRYIGGILLSQNIYRFNLDPAGIIKNFQATLVPVSADLYAAVKREKITEQEARAIVDRDLAELAIQKAGLVIDESTLAANWKAPHVLWDVRGTYEAEHDKVTWYYGIDALSGKIVRRSCATGREYLGAPSGDIASPCDVIPPIP